MLVKPTSRGAPEAAHTIRRGAQQGDREVERVLTRKTEHGCVRTAARRLGTTLVAKATIWNSIELNRSGAAARTQAKQRSYRSSVAWIFVSALLSPTFRLVLIPTVSASGLRP